MSKKDKLTKIPLTDAQQKLLAKIGLESREMCIDPSTGSCELMDLRKPGLIRVTDEQSQSIQAASGNGAVAGFDVNPKTFAIELVDVSDARRIKAMWGEGPK